jgi:DNA-binding response OmpR family regulator
MHMTRVLVVDDDPTVREVVCSYLRAECYDVSEAGDGETALAMVADDRPDLVVLDVMLPGVDGLEVCRQVRATTDLPVILLTALGAEADRVVGLELGADDYLTKPFSPRELVLRVGSVLRRSGEAAPPDLDVVRDGDLVIDGPRRQVYLFDRAVPLTMREFDLLRFFVANPGTAFTRVELLDKVWGWSFGDQSTVTVHARRLREKIETDPTSPTRLVTVWGVGYRWEES